MAPRCILRTVAVVLLSLVGAGCASPTPAPVSGANAGPLTEAPLSASVDPWQLTNESFIDSLTVTWPKSERDALLRAAEHGVVVARLNGERLVAVPGCHTEGAYQHIPGDSDSRRVSMRDANELADVLLLGGKRYLPVVQDVGELFVESHAVSIYRFDTGIYFTGFPRARLSGSCADASHVIEELWIGAFELGARDLPKGTGAAPGETLIREGGRLKHCEKVAKDAPPPASCRELIAIDARPIVDAPPARPRDPNEPFEYSPGSEPHCPVLGALRMNEQGQPYCAESQKSGATPLAKNRARFEIRGALALDKKTGLIWRRDSPPTLMSWQQARDYCHALDGRAGFMLPTPTQLATLIEPELFPAADVGVFPDLVSSDGSPIGLSFWTTDRGPVGPDDGSTMSFDRGSTSTGANTLRARCVRLPRPAQGS